MKKRNFWLSNEKLTNHGLGVAYFGILITILAQIFPGNRWVSYFGIVMTASGVILRHRAEHVKKLLSAPRKISQEQAAKILESLKPVSKRTLTVGFFGQDPEAEQFALQIKGLLESAGFQIGELEGFMVFRFGFGLQLMVHGTDGSNPIAIGIRDAFQKAGLELQIQLNPDDREPPITLNVYGKPPADAD